MIKINALMFLFIIESLLIFLGLTVFLFLKYSKLLLKYKKQVEEGVSKVKGRDDFEKYLEKVIEELQKEVDVYKEEPEKITDLDTAIMKEIHLSRHYFVLAALDGVKKSSGNNMIFWENIIKRFDEINEKQLQKVKTSEIEKAKELKEARSEFSDEVEKLKDVIESQKKEIAEKDVLSKKIAELEKELNERNKAFDFLQNNFNMIEKEYFILYKEHKQETPQE